MKPDDALERPNRSLEDAVEWDLVEENPDFVGDMPMPVYLAVNKVLNR